LAIHRSFFWCWRAAGLVGADEGQHLALVEEHLLRRVVRAKILDLRVHAAPPEDQQLVGRMLGAHHQVMLVGQRHREEVGNVVLLRLLAFPAKGGAQLLVTHHQRQIIDRMLGVRGRDLFAHWRHVTHHHHLGRQGAATGQENKESRARQQPDDHLQAWGSHVLARETPARPAGCIGCEIRYPARFNLTRSREDREIVIPPSLLDSSRSSRLRVSPLSPCLLCEKSSPFRRAAKVRLACQP
jgi:hypothetical protein